MTGAATTLRRLAAGAGPAERGFALAALAAWPLKVAADAGAPAALLTAAQALALVLGLLALARRGPRVWLDGWRLGLAALALWSLGEVYALVGGDGIEYYATARSLLMDRDLDYGNEFGGLGAQVVLSPQGEPTSRFPIGLSLLWMPAMALAHLGVLASRAFGAAVPADGFSVAYQSAATATSYLLVVAGLLLLERLLRPRYGAAVAFLSVAGVWLATPLHFYATANPSMSHGPSAALVTLFLAAWLAARDGDDPRRWLLLGAAGGVMSLVRIQDGVLIALPALDRLLRGGAGRLRSVARLAVGPALAAALQLGLWAALYGGAFLRVASKQGHFSRPELHLVDVLLSANHGLLLWHPIHVAALAGWLIGRRRERGLCLYFALGFLVAATFNSLMLDWWGNDAFGQRRLVSLTPFFAVGIAETIAFLARRPLLPVAAVVLALVVWNLQFAYIFNSQMITGRNRPISLDRLAAAQAEVAYRRWIGWADWMPRRVWVLGYDALRGVWLDEGPRSLRGRIELGDEDPPFPVVGHGWARPQSEDGETVFRRSNVPRSWLLVPIRTPADFEVSVRIRSELETIPVRLTLELNGEAVGSAELEPVWQLVRFEVPEALVRPGVNALSLHYSPTPAEAIPGFRGRNAAVAVEWVRFERREEP